MATDRLHTMRVFCRVAELQSFTKAAHALNLPKANVSHALSHLESDLGVRLLNRTTRQVSVTPDGAAYYERVLRILADIDETEATLKDVNRSPNGRLRVDVPVGVARSLIIPALPEFVQQYPDIELQLGVSDRSVDLIEEGVDCVVRGGQLADSSLIARKLGELRCVRVASRAYLHRYGTPRTIEDLSAHRAVHYFSGTTGRVYDLDYLDAQGQVQTIAMRHHLSVNDSQALLHAALAGLGITDLPVFSAYEHLQAGELLAVLPELEPTSIPVWVMYAHNRHLSAKVRVFVQWVTDLVRREIASPRNAPWPAATTQTPAAG
jgi:LysR family transcriptional regulator, regulator for bpeEF and oprC